VGGGGGVLVVCKCSGFDFVVKYSLSQKSINFLLMLGTSSYFFKTHATRHFHEVNFSITVDMFIQIKMLTLSNAKQSCTNCFNLRKKGKQN
jgi:hypothetical protein